MSKEKDESIRRLAFCVWQNRCRLGERDANDEKVNWAIAKLTLYPNELSFDELEILQGR